MKRLTTLLALALLLPFAVLAQTYPSKSIRLLVPFAAGGTTDVIATICSSVKRLFFIGSSLGCGSHSLNLRLVLRTWAGQCVTENELSNTFGWLGVTVVHLCSTSHFGTRCPRISKRHCPVEYFVISEKVTMSLELNLTFWGVLKARL